ncbi:MarR family winged helix-turn-helix transcriptional regulator [Sphaerisporangium sp. TRM90804]|uniref:MarR family winged helix-turn-helix transcriptional regulator n=1 Tax=Sphaerisporangium sp. TRM90804 TaxID=3031113 RepID=UPI00244A6807|nr:MarR family winged helix-turn-helix transcriptional regulator [Sphaerisporangium sp. TRM90804]MDH2429671.1 MarR family winged helix-turn-helix transcriptional regulator [Sphaerisporangium sp. TRM90804]
MPDREPEGLRNHTKPDDTARNHAEPDGGPAHPAPAEDEPDGGPWGDGEPDLPLWELIQTSHVVARRFTEVFASVGLTPTQFGVLASLADRDDLTQAELARAIMVRPQSMNELFVSLLERGLVARDGPGGRGRRTGLRITEAGRALLHHAQPPVAAFNAPGAIGLSPAEAADLTRLLRIVRETLS